MSKTRSYFHLVRKASTNFKEAFQHGYKMKAWNVHSYQDPLQLSSVRIPTISNPNDVLIKVEAASLNPIDKLMLGSNCN